MTTVARTSFGALRGEALDDVVVFRGVPYAASPTGERRWRPAQPVSTWTDVRDATAFGSIPPQDISPERLAKRGLTMSEDCLTLNVWTPAADDTRRPVLVFLHGGGQAQGHGSAPLLDGARLARRGGIVVVTMNFRLGVLGSLYAPDWHGADSTNLTVRDQQYALQWVRDEIGAFGGDPSAVTVAGQSSGAIAISVMLAGGCGLFDRAILQSGGLERVRSTEAAVAVAARLRALMRDDEPGVDEILAAQRGIDPGFVPPQGPFHPCIDGDVIAEHPLVVARTRSMPAIPILAGTTRDEWRIFDAAFDDGVFTEQYVRDRAQALAGDRHDPDAVVDRYRADHGPLRDVASAMVTDYHFTAPTEQFVRAHAERGNAVLRYELQWPSPRAGFGACHDSCLALVFGNLDAAPALAGNDEAARHMSDVVQSLWVDFIRGGEPWVRYDGSGGSTMLLGRESGVTRDHRSEQLAIWEGRYPAYG
ncbi:MULTISPECIES: carboxylesterase/lipase family protein [Mycolicibacterium]|uniref:Carboxylic ester hydrolase n=2 Tax=Mycolicibacterium gilvum TaxID=1804 RepID=E6TKD8_MYCSR|nr:MULTISPECIES: carboxylesterase family protein [Mycolicibacterium]ABP46867.1 Carboxylesterase, type B [Mycolicibacterium gilvum PYR-GCK]ADU00353.1 carboxylesterase type B [Mycolicibacterium gilvum Spyr1]MBV5244952.1 carboxylesterase family protein [Mycolicibacterium sp. PAM1]